MSGHPVVCAAGPSATAKEQLVQKLIQEFPQIFKLVTIHITPAYGCDAPAGELSVEATSSVTVSADNFKVGAQRACTTATLGQCSAPESCLLPE